MSENSKVLPLVEAYKCIQAEGPYTGIPHILLRTTGCPMRCQFGNSFCDTPYTSWKPEKGSITFDDVIKLYIDNPQIKHTMITGGSPTMHPELLQELTAYLADSFDQFITLETEGSKYVEGLTNTIVSLSPKLKSSRPIPGRVNLYTGRAVSERDLNQHEKNRCNYNDMKQLIDEYGGYVKPVINMDTFDNDMEEVKEIVKILEVNNNDVWLMPAGINNEQLGQCRQKLVEYCIDSGYNYTDRLQVIIYGEKRGV